MVVVADVLAHPPAMHHLERHPIPGGHAPWAAVPALDNHPLNPVHPSNLNANAGPALRKRLLYPCDLKTVRTKNPAAVALGARGGQAGVGAVKRRGDPDYYRRLVARRKDRQAGTTAMPHRHLNHQDFTLAAIDDIIGRGQRPAWEALRSAVLLHAVIREKVLRVCAARVSDPAAQRFHFWNLYARAHQAAA